MSKRKLVWSLMSCLLVMICAEIQAGGISVDAGLTPAQDKWILRTQIRYMQRSNDPSLMPKEMETFMFPMVVAYGVRPDLTLMIRQMYISKSMTMGTMTTDNDGLGDLFLLAKYRAFRYNTSRYTIGIAPLLALQMPTGKSSLTSDAWDLKTGLFISGRRGSWGSDWNLTYTFNSLAGPSNRKKSEVIEIVGAFAYQIAFGEAARIAFAPVVEIAYNNATADKIAGEKLANSGESYFLISPGAKLTVSSIIFEVLLQVPVWQNQIGIQTEKGVGALFGIRVLL